MGEDWTGLWAARKGAKMAELARLAAWAGKLSFSRTAVRECGDKSRVATHAARSAKSVDLGVGLKGLEGEGE